MYIVHVHVHVKAESIDNFILATIENASHSLQEPGVARFDFIQDQSNPTKFVLVEVYRTVDDSGKHKTTAHYARWREAVEELMAEPRISYKYNNIYPVNTEW
jgi:quinol monooxygenase YgiN